MGATDYFAVATQIARDHAQTVKDAQVTRLTREYMSSPDYRADCIIDVLECEKASELAIILEELVYGSPSVRAEAKRKFQEKVENAAMAYARSQI